MGILAKVKTKEGKESEKREDLRIYNPRELYLLTTNIISSYNDESELGPRDVVQYYLATKEGKEYYELFSKVKIEYSKNDSKDFNVPYIKKEENMTGYVKNPNLLLTAKELFYFITEINICEKVKEI